MAEKWMAKAFANSHGQFREKAKRAGMSTAAYAAKHEGDSGKTGAQARLAERGMEANHGKSKTSEERMRGRYKGK